jgi:hypothetical protein
VISPYARSHYVDHQVLSHDAYLKFIEDDFLGGERLNPLTDGRPDARPTVREASPVLGNLLGDFDFSQPPAPPLLLPPHPGAWYLPAGFRLVLHTARRQRPRYHRGGIALGVTCLTRCRLRVGGYVRARRGRPVVLPARTYTIAGSVSLTMRLPASARSVVAGAGPAGRVTAHLSLSATALVPATPLTPKGERTQGSLQVALAG